jgi:ABC-type sugar transport system permease subunit
VAALVLLAGSYTAIAVVQRANDLKRFEEAHALLLARAVAWVEAESTLREDAEQTQKFVVGAKEALPELREVSVLKGTKFVAHTDEARAGQRLDRDSLADKDLYDIFGKLKASVGKNIDEREKHPELARDSFLELEVKRTEAGIVEMSVPSVADGQFGSIARVVVEPPKLALPLPWKIYGAALLALLIFVGLAYTRKSAGIIAGGVILLAAVAWYPAGELAAWRTGIRQAEMTAHGQALGTLAKAGLLSAASLGNQESLIATLARTPEGEAANDLIAVRSATIAAAPIADSLRVAADPYEVYYRTATFSALEQVDRDNLWYWVIALGIAGVCLFVLGERGQLSRAGSSVAQHAYAYTYLSPAMLGMLVLVFIPVVFGLVLGFMTREYNIYEFVGLANYVAILGDFNITHPANFYFKLGVTILWTLSNVVLHVGIGLFLALLLNDPIMKARGIFRVLLVVPWAMPNYITALIWKGMFHRQFGVVNTFLTTMGLEPIAWFQTFWPAFFTNVATNTWLGFPFMMVVSLGALQSIPTDLYEAAFVDGASRWQRFYKITLPLLMPALVPAVIVGTVWTFNMFNIIYLVSAGAPDGATDILITEAYRWAFERDRYGYAAAYSTVIFMILLAFTMVTNRITGATKGSFE